MRRKVQKIGGSWYMPLPADIAELMDVDKETEFEYSFNGKNEVCCTKVEKK